MGIDRLLPHLVLLVLWFGLIRLGKVSTNRNIKGWCTADIWKANSNVSSFRAKALCQRAEELGFAVHISAVHQPFIFQFVF